ncbi:MAG: hypothetical protein ED554_05650 [Synechococcus sp. YX04-3]|nr:MAG: hypothetical protein ED554_05650 [Synechococcus sp. YX04-3]
MNKRQDLLLRLLNNSQKAVYANAAYVHVIIQLLLQLECLLELSSDVGVFSFLLFLVDYCDWDGSCLRFNSYQAV